MNRLFQFFSCLLILAFISGFANADDAIPTDNKALPFGDGLEDVSQWLTSQCDEITISNDLPLEVPTATQNQSQIDCKNYRPMNHQGLSEWVFADDELDIVWVLTKLDSLAAAKKQLIKGGIKADFERDGMAEFYLERGFGLRYEPVEFLYFSNRLIPFYQAWIEDQTNGEL